MRHALALAVVLAACSDDAPGTHDAAPGVDATDDAPTPDAPELAAPEIVVDQLRAPFALAIVGDQLYVSDSSDATIKACAIADCAGTLATFATGQVVQVDALHAVGDQLVWATNTQVATCPASGCSAPTTLHAGALNITALAVTAAGDVYFADRATQTIQRVPIAGGALQPIAAGVDDVRGLWVDGGGVVFTTYGSLSGGATAKVQRCPLGGCAGAPTLVSGTHVGLGAVGVTSDGTHVIWAEATRIARCPTAGCTGETLMMKTSSFERLLLVDGTLLWSAYPLGLHTCSMAACATTYATRAEPPTIQAFTVDATHVYWVASSAIDDGLVARMPRP